MPGAVAATTVPGASRHRAERARTSAAQPCRVAPRRSDSAGVCRVCYRPHRVCPSLMAPCVAEQESSSSAASRPTDAALRLQVRAAPLRRQPRPATLHISPRRAETTQEGWELLGTQASRSARSPGKRCAPLTFSGAAGARRGARRAQLGRQTKEARRGSHARAPIRHTRARHTAASGCSSALRSALRSARRARRCPGSCRAPTRRAWRPA